VRVCELDPRVKAIADVKLLWKYQYPEENFINFTVKNGNQTMKLNTYRYCTAKDPVCIVVIFHSFNGHMNTSAYLAKNLAERGACVVGYDQRGFGKSEGIKSYIQSIDTLVEDGKVFIKQIKEMYPDKPLFIGGLSMGGLVTYRLTLEDKNICNGAIFFAPALKPNAGKFNQTVGMVLGKIIPRVKTFKPQRHKSSKSKFSVDMLNSDPLHYNDGARMGSLKALLVSMKSCEKTFKDYQANYLMFFGGQDKTVNAKCGFDMLNVSASEDKTLYFYENLWHDIWHEEEMFDIVPKVIDWIEKRLPNQAANNDDNDNNKNNDGLQNMNNEYNLNIV